MDREWGIAIIGCGMMGRNHATQWSKRKDAKVVAVYDVDRERADGLAEEYGAVVWGSCEEAINAQGVGIVSICTPVCFHPEIAIRAAKAGRHILCEKPIALTLKDADAMIGAARKAGVFFSVSYQYRGQSKNCLYKEMVKDGRIAGPLFARYVDCREVRPKLAMHEAKMNGGPVIDMAGHFFDLMRFITGAEPISVYASGHVLGKGKPRLEPVGEHSVDAAEIQVRYLGGHVLSVFVHWGLPERTKTFGHEYLSTAECVIKYETGQVTVEQGSQAIVYRLEPDPEGSSATIDWLIKAISGDPSRMVSGEDGRRALSVSLGALESIRTGRRVALPS